MNGRINNVQIIEQGGVPAFAVIPYDEYLALTKLDDSEVFLPTEVVEMTLDGDSLIKAWRRYKKMSQVELAEKIGVSQAAIAQVEKADKPHKNTIKRIAAAMGLRPEHLIE
ncbi:helix-turn-helix domain-containing protein [Photobacterium damselae]|uniref:helix-turn-helix domain-containing protein n=1 Tax=Photobacterium damselae TaxID=38293 RepID=UPI001F2A9493|nr:helix-turn-helix transcriptional regulator [Photobacterium damselae]UKA12961.1 helix-turn-helix domain-containing protein [Photobacterium damselae subsp. damselae]